MWLSPVTDKGPRVRFLLAPLFVLLLAACSPNDPGSSAASCVAQNDWRVGNIVRVCQGTQIWQAGSLGSCYHTVVPVQNWEVRVTSLERSEGGRRWYDTSRLLAGDPLGGTGWINREQADNTNSTLDPGSVCPGYESQVAGHLRQIEESKRNPDDTDDPIVITVPQFLLDLQAWWYSQPLPVKIGVLVVAFLLIPFSRRLFGFGGRTLTGLVSAVLWGIIIAGVADLSRPIWQGTWNAITGDQLSLDLALALLVLPVALWAFSQVARVASRAVSVLLVVVLGLIALFYIAPDRFNALIGTVKGWLNL